MTTVGGDGRFNIERGQGLSQAIIKELGIEANSDDAKKLNSVWGKIFNLVEAENNTRQNGNKIYSGGSDIKGPTSKNFVMTIGQAVDLSNIWEQIKTLVQNAGAKMNPTPSQGSGNSDPVTTVGGTPQATATLESTQQDATNVATRIHKARTESDNKDEMITTMRKELAQITPENAAYVFERYNQLKDKNGNSINILHAIGTVNDWGNGFDKTEMFQYVIRPLLIRANALGIEYDLDGKKPEDLSKKEMLNLATKLSKDIKAKDAEGFIPQQTANYNEAIKSMTPENVASIDTCGDGSKIIRLNDGNEIKVEYQNGKITQIHVNVESLTNVKVDTANDNKLTNGSYYDVRFVSDGVISRQNYNGDNGSLTVENYDFEAIKALVQAMLDSQTE